MSQSIKKENEHNQTWWKADFVTLSLTGHIAQIVSHFPLKICYQSKSNYPSHMGAFIRRTEEVTASLHQWHKEKDTAIAALIAYSKAQVVYHKSLLEEKLALDEALVKNIEVWTKPLAERVELDSDNVNVSSIPVSPFPYESEFKYNDQDSVHGARNLNFNPRPSRNYEQE